MTNGGKQFTGEYLATGGVECVDLNEISAGNQI